MGAGPQSSFCSLPRIQVEVVMQRWQLVWRSNARLWTEASSRAVSSPSRLVNHHHGNWQTSARASWMVQCPPVGSETQALHWPGTFDISIPVELLQSFWWHVELTAWSAVHRRQWHVARVATCWVAIVSNILLA